MKDKPLSINNVNMKNVAPNKVFPFDTVNITTKLNKAADNKPPIIKFYLKKVSKKK